MGEKVWLIEGIGIKRCLKIFLRKWEDQSEQHPLSLTSLVAAVPLLLLTFPHHDASSRKNQGLRGFWTILWLCKINFFVLFLI